MDTETQRDDVQAIETIIARQFACSTWTRGTPADWNAFSADFLPGATLYPAARPPTSQTVEGFVDRMKSLAETKLHSFKEVVLGSKVEVFGNVAVAVAACETTENDAQVERAVEMMLLVKDQGRWRIVSQAWDKAGPSNPIPANLLARV
jgi:ketosteroid isomerase-like protein